MQSSDDDAKEGHEPMDRSGEAPSDAALLERYVSRKSEEAFTTVVNRHIGLVYAAALRQVGDPHAAQDVTQTVFLLLARKAHQIRPNTVLAGWLFKAVRFTAAAHQKSEARRRRREREAHMDYLTPESAEEAPWEQMAPLLDDALARLSERDRQAVLLRYFEKRSLSDVGKALAIKDEAARKRVARAIEKVRKYFVRRGAAPSAVALETALLRHGISQAPEGLIAKTAALAVESSTIMTSILILLQETSKLMLIAKIKNAASITAASLLVVGAALALRQPVAEASSPVRQPAAVAALRPTSPPSNANTQMAAAVSPALPSASPLDGWSMLVASQTGIIRVDLSSGQHQRILNTGKAMRGVALDLSRGLLFAGGDRLYRYDLFAGNHTVTAMSGAIGRAGTGDLALAANGDLLVAGGSQNEILRYNAATGGLIDTVALGGNVVGVHVEGNIAYGPEVFLGTIARFDLSASPVSVTRLVTDPQNIKYGLGLTMNGKGNILIAGRDNGRLQEYDTATGKFLGTFADVGSMGYSKPTDVHYEPQLNLYFVTVDAGVVILNAAGERIAMDDNPMLRAPIQVITARNLPPTPNGDEIATIIESAPPAAKPADGDVTGQVMAAAAAPLDGWSLVAAGQNGMIRVDLASGEYQKIFSLAKGMRGVAVDVGRGLLFGGGDRVYRYDLTAANPAPTPLTGTIGRFGAGHLALGPNGVLLVAGDSQHEILRYNIDTGALIDALALSQNAVGLHVEGDVAYASEVFLGTIARFDLSASPPTMTRLVTDPANIKYGLGLAVSRGGNILIAARDSVRVQEYDSKNGKFVGTFADLASMGYSKPTDVQYEPKLNLYFVTVDTGVVVFNAAGKRVAIYDNPLIHAPIQAITVHGADWSHVKP